MAYSLTYDYVESTNSYSVKGYSNITESDKVIIPSTYIDGTHGELPVTVIGVTAFENCVSLTSIFIPDSVTIIRDYAFSGCSGLTSVKIGNGVTSINNWAFDNCSGLTSVIIPDSVTSIGAFAFRGCSGLTSVTIPDSVTIIKNNAFSGCSGLTSVKIGNGVTSIGTSVFEDCSGLRSITIPDSVTNIDGRSFSGCSGLTSITIPDSVTSIGYRAFYDCRGLTSVTIGEGVTSIGSSAFQNCTSLMSVTIPNSVTTIDSSAFAYCTSLTQLILFPSTPPTLASNAILNVQTIYVPQSSKVAYQAATNWTKFASKIVSDNIYLSFVRFNQKNKEYINRKVDKLPDLLRNQAYVRNANGEDTGLAYTYTDEGNTLALRNASGQLQVSDPSQDKDAANKSYADNLTARYVSTSILGG